MPRTNPNPAPTPHPGTPQAGAWTQDPASHAWTWKPGATPDPALAKAWGTGAMTDVRQDPTGVRNHGAWTGNGRGWTWTWGADPDPTSLKLYGKDVLTNPDRSPNGADTKARNTPPPPDVKPPTVADAWGGVPPDVTGTLPGSTGSTTTVDHPPAHPAFLVSPGSIRNAEVSAVRLIDQGIVMYNSLKNYVAMSHGQNLYTNGAGWEQIVVPEDRLLLSIGDALELAGQFTEMLNVAAQSYAKADKDSFMPGS